MNKLESTVTNMVISLVVISAVMSFALSYVHKVTLEPIKQGDIKAIKRSLQAVLPEFNNNPMEEKKDMNGIIFYIAKKDNNIVGYAAETFSDKAYSGTIKIMVGFLPDGTIYKTNVLEQKETPGLGSKIKTEWNEQFNNKNPKDFKVMVKKDGGNVDAISGATISSRAYCDAINKAYDIFIKNFVQGNK